MDKVIKIIISILTILLAFLVGWGTHASINRNKVRTEVKKTIEELNEQHKKALKSLKDNYDEKLKKKDEIIADLKKIVDRLIKLFESTEGKEVERVIHNLRINQEKLRSI